MEDFLFGDGCELEAAFRSGNAELAAGMVKMLAEKRSKINLEVVKNASSPPEKLITINIFIEDRHSAGTCIPLKIRPSTTFQTLSRMMYERFEFPLQVQQWIVQRQKRIHNLNTSLSKMGIVDGDAIHLYLLPAYSVNVTKESAESTYFLAFPSTTRQRSRDHSNVPVTDGTESDVLASSSLQENSVSESQIQPISTPLGNTNITVGDHTRDTLGSLSITVGWSCPMCTYINEPTRPGCIACAGPRPDQYQVPPGYVPTEAELQRLASEGSLSMQLEAERQSNREKLLSADQLPLVTNTEPFECKICFDNIAPGDGVVLRDCLHMFCKDCLRGQVEAATSPTVGCPFNDGTHTCDGVLQEREIKAMVSDDVYAKVLALSVQEAESREGQSFHCRTPDCRGWCIYEDDVNTFDCPVCNVSNCLTCKAQHVDKTCRQYQDDLKARAGVDKAAKRTQKQIEKMLRKGDAMLCPTCQIVVMKKDGCDWIRCSMCKTEICWVTKGPRWGPERHFLLVICNLQQQSPPEFRHLSWKFNLGLSARSCVGERKWRSTSYPIYYYFYYYYCYY